MTVIAVNPSLQFFDSNGDPLSGGLLYTYEAGTTTPKATYTDSTAATEHANPIELDSAGRPPGGSIWVNGSYKFVLQDSDGVQISETDNVSSFSVVEPDADTYYETFSGDGNQTAFTLSEDLGEDENAVFIWVGGTIQAPTTYTVDGTSLTFTSAPASGTNNIAVRAPSTLVAAAAASADAAAASATAASNSASDAATSESNAATSESNAATSESNAATSESNAAASASAAAASAGEAADSASDAAASAIAATQPGSDNFVGRWSDQTGAATVPTSVAHEGAVWVLLQDIADITADEPGVTANWQEVGLTSAQITDEVLLFSLIFGE